MRRVLPPLLALLALPAAFAAPSDVHTEKTGAGWVLKVDGKPFFIQGIACDQAMGEHGEDYLKMAADAGANAVRVYGSVTPVYLDHAQNNGLKVNVGFWFNAIRLKTKESYKDAAHRRALRDEVMAYVRKYKNHPAVLAWTMGNEVFRFTDEKDERDAFGAFLEDLIQTIHKEDPHHPIIYASSYSNDLAELQKWAPDIDIVGVNVTGGANSAIHWTTLHQFDKPVVVTEFAPFGAWEQRKDANDQPYDPFDQFKADNYRSSWRQIKANPQVCIGGFAFLLGDQRNQDSLTWYNMNYGALKRAGYWTIHELYTGKPAPYAYPKITMFEVSPSSGVAPGSRIRVAVTASAASPGKTHTDYFVTSIFSDPLIVEKGRFFPADVKTENGETTVRAPAQAGTYRVYAHVTDDHGSVAIASHSIKVH